MILNEAIQIMTNEIVTVLADNKPTIYLFGSVALDDFQLGWSDIDILVLTDCEITEQQAETLVGLRQALLEHYPGNPYFRLFEGGMLSTDAFLHNNNERTVYWGTGGQRITDGYKIDSFGMAELLDCGIPLYGDDIRSEMIYPTYAQMCNDITHHVQAARTHGVVVGWLLDIARGIYTLRTGKIIAKTAAGEWALENGLCPDADILQKAVQIRKEPQRFTKEDKSVDNTVIQRFADVLDVELKAKPMIFEYNRGGYTDAKSAFIRAVTEKARKETTLERMMENNHWVEEILKDRNLALIGFADISGIDAEIRYGYQYGICIAIALKVFPSTTSEPSKDYYDEYKAVSARLREASDFLADKIKECGFNAYSLAHEKQNEAYRTQLPFKTLATRAGLGWIGKSAALITKEYGNAIRLNGVLTDLPIKVGTPVNESLCGECDKCVKHCPGHAITGNTWRLHIDRDILLDAVSCKKAVIERGKVFNVSDGTCGICISVCPWTKQYRLELE